MISFLFALIFFSNILINVDHGTFPGATNAMLNSIPLSVDEFGIVGSIVYLGLTCGAALATPVFDKPSLIKPALFLSLLLNGVSLLGYGIRIGDYTHRSEDETNKGQFYLFCGLRFVTGFC